MEVPQQPNRPLSQLTLGSSLPMRKTLVSALLTQTGLPLATVALESGLSGSGNCVPTAGMCMV